MKKLSFLNSLVMGMAIIGVFVLSSPAEAANDGFDPKKDCVFFDKIVFNIKKVDNLVDNADSGNEFEGPFDIKVQDEFGKVLDIKEEVYKALDSKVDKQLIEILSVEFAADCKDEKIDGAINFQ